MNDNMNQNNNMNPMYNTGSNMNNNMNMNNGMNQQPMNNMNNMNNNMMNNSMNSNMNMNNGMNQQPMNNMNGNQNMNNMNNGMMPNNMNQTPKKNNTLLYAIIGVVAVILIAVVAVIALGNNGDSKTEGSKSSSLTSLDNYKIEEHLLVDKSILLEFKNNNSVSVDASFKVEYYDKAGEVIDVEEVYLIGVPAKSSAYDEINYHGKVSYDSYKFTNMSVREDTYTKNYKDDIEILSKKDNEDSILIQFKNNSKKDLEYLTYIVLFYDKDGKIISYSPESEMNFKSGATLTSKVHHPYDDNFELLNYAKYEVVVIAGLTN